VQKSHKNQRTSICMKGGNRRDFISQVDRLIAVRHGGERPTTIVSLPARACNAWRTFADCTSESLRTSRGAYQDLLCLELMEGKASQQKRRHSFLQFKHSLRMARIRPDRLLQSVFSSLAENHPLKSHTECKNLFKPRKGEPTHRADNQRGSRINILKV
jgi:hypothetical protein